MSPESARPRTAGTSMPGFHWSLSLAAGPGVAVGEGLDHPEHVVDRVLVAVAELADRLVQRAAQRPAQPLVGPGLELAGAPALAHGRAAQRVEQHRLADAAQPGEHEAALGAALGHPLEHDVEGGELLVAPGQLGRALAGAGGVRVPDRVHDRTVSADLGEILRLPRSPRVEESARVSSSGRPLARGVVRLVEPSRSMAIRSGTSSAASRNVPAHTLSRHSGQHDQLRLLVPGDAQRRGPHRAGRGRPARCAGSPSLLGHVPFVTPLHKGLPRLGACPSCPRWKPWSRTCAAG